MDTQGQKKTIMLMDREDWEVWNNPDGYIKRTRPLDYTDQDQVNCMAEVMESKIAYTGATGFLHYNGRYWEENEAGAAEEIRQFMDMQRVGCAIEMEICQDKVKKLGLKWEQLEKTKFKQQDWFSEEQRYWVEESQKAYELQCHVKKYRGYRNRENMLKDSKAVLSISADQLDADPYQLNTPLGTFRLQDGWVKGHNWQDYITKMTACYPGEAGKELWQDALDTFFCGDKDLQEYVQQIVGMAAIGKVFAETLIIAYGEGRNGKSTFWNTIANVLGSYSGSLSADVLTQGCRRNVKPELAELKGKRLIIASELEEGTRLSTSLMKQLCSVDRIYGEKKYKDPFSFVPSHTVVLYTNHLPKVTANDEGTWRRLKVIPFKATIPEQKDIKDYGGYLVENAGPAVLQWVIDGAVKAIACNFKPEEPEAVRKETGRYRADNDWMGDFLEECCIQEENRKCPSGELYATYRRYCMEQGEYIRDTKRFYEGLKSLGFERKKTNKGNVILGLEMVQQERDII